MSNKHKLSGQPSSALQQRFMELCTRFGQEVQNESRAQKAQETLKRDMDETEKAFIIAAEREKEAAQRKANDEARKLHVTKKDEAAPTTETPAPAEGQSA